MSLFHHTPDLNLPNGSDPVDSLMDFNINDLDFGDSEDVDDLNLPNESDPVDSLMDLDLDFGDSEDVPDLNLRSESDPVDSLMDFDLDLDFGDSEDVPDLNLPNPVDSLMDLDINDLLFGLDFEFGWTEALLAQFGGGEDENYVLPSASNAVVDCVLITQQDVDNDKVTCAVCTDDMNVGDMAKQLPCFHRYHGDCIRPWLTRLEELT